MTGWINQCSMFNVQCWAFPKARSIFAGRSAACAFPCFPVSLVLLYHLITSLDSPMHGFFGPGSCQLGLSGSSPVCLAKLRFTSTSIHLSRFPHVCANITTTSTCALHFPSNDLIRRLSITALVSAGFNPEKTTMPSKRELQDLDEGEISEPGPKRAKRQTGATPRHQHQNSSIDPTWGQKYVFSSLGDATTIPCGDESDFEDDADAMAYLHSVR